MPTCEWITDQIFTVAEFFSPAECDEAIRNAESIGFTDAPITTLAGPVMRRDVRNNTRVMLDDQPRAKEIWQRASEFVPAVMEGWKAVGVNERFRFYRYDVGQQFNWHRDGYFERDNGDRSRLTFMIYLNEDFEGGQTSFKDTKETVVVPKRGLALFFVHHIVHKGEPVTQGRKYVIRTDVMYREDA